MKKHSAAIIISIGFILLSIILFTIHFYIFHDSHHIFIYLLGDLAFLPIEVLLVSLIFHKIIDDKDKKEKLKKTNMILGVFFSEAGIDLMTLFINLDQNINSLQKNLTIQENWSQKDYKSAIKSLKNFEYDIAIQTPGLLCIQEFLFEKRSLLISFLENPILIEHDDFTNLVIALSHTEQELSHRKNFDTMEPNDRSHLILDIQRIYPLLFIQWLNYMNHLRKSYPFLYSFSIRTNPFDPNATVEIP